MFFDCEGPYRTTETYIHKGADDVVALIDGQVVVTQAMQLSPFNKPLKGTPTRGRPICSVSQRAWTSG